jgi:hypothetical protein
MIRIVAAITALVEDGMSFHYKESTSEWPAPTEWKEPFRSRSKAV